MNAKNARQLKLPFMATFSYFFTAQRRSYR